MNRTPPHPVFSPGGGEGARRAVEGDSDRFMAPSRVQNLEVPPTHEPFVRSSRRKEAQTSWAQGDQSLLTSAATVQGLNARRFAWGNSFHEPPLTRPSATLSPPCGERAGRAVPIWFMVPMHAKKRKEAFHEPCARRA